MVRKFKNLKRALVLLTTASVLVGGFPACTFADEIPTEEVGGEAAEDEREIPDADGEAGEPEAQDLENEGEGSGETWTTGSDKDEDTYVYELQNSHLSGGTIDIANTKREEGSTVYIYELTDTSDEKKTTFYGYCVDMGTGAMLDGQYYYKRENIEDSKNEQLISDEEGFSVSHNHYYTPEEAEKIRAILENGYRPDSETSLSNLISAAQVEGLTADEATAATQWAIWKISNDDSFYEDQTYIPKTNGTALDAASTARIQTVVDYLMSLEGTKAETVILNSDNLKESNVTETVSGKDAAEVAEDLKENLDVEALEAMEAGEKKLQTSDEGNVYLITKNDNGSFTVE